MNKKGFTLVELMVVIVIIGVLAAVAIPKMMAATNKAKAGEGPQILRSIANMESAYKAEQDVFTTAPVTNKEKPKAKGEAVADEWLSLGFDIEPFSKYFTFEVLAPTPSDGFSAVAKLYQTLGDATKDANSLEVDERDIRTINNAEPVSTTPMAKLVPNWK